MGRSLMKGRTVDYSDVQGLLRFGYGKMTEASYALLRVKNATAARRWLGNAKVTSAVRMDSPPTSALQIAFTADGLKALEVAPEAIAGFSAEFLTGMTEESRTRRLGDVDRNAEGRTELLSVHLVVPRPMGWFYHDTFAHPVHHLHPKIPCYHVYRAQTHLDRRLGSAAVVSKFGIAWLLDTTRRCKLYDWDRHRWLRFDGTPTTEPIAAVRQGDCRRLEHGAALRTST